MFMHFYEVRRLISLVQMIGCGLRSVGSNAVRTLTGKRHDFDMSSFIFNCILVVGGCSNSHTCSGTR